MTRETASSDLSFDTFDTSAQSNQCRSRLPKVTMSTPAEQAPRKRGVQHAIDQLAALGSASTLETFMAAWQDAATEEMLDVMDSHAKSMLATGQTGMSEGLTAALAQGMQLLAGADLSAASGSARSTAKSSAGWKQLQAVFAICRLCRCQHITLDAAADMPEVRMQAATSGLLLKAFQQLCAALAAAVDAHASSAAPGTATQLQDNGVAVLAGVLLWLFNNLTEDLPAPVLFSPSVAPAVAAAGRLAAALLHNEAACWQPGGGSSTSSGRGRRAGGSLQQAGAAAGCSDLVANTDSCLEISDFVNVIVTTNYQHVCDTLASCAGTSKAFTRSGSILELLLLWLSLSAQQLHTKQHGLSPVAADSRAGRVASRQQQQQQAQIAVPPLHEHMLHTLGVPARLQQPLQIGENASDPSNVLSLLIELIAEIGSDLNIGRPVSGFSSSSNTAGTSSSSSTSTSTSPEGLLVPLLLLMVEVMALQPAECANQLLPIFNVVLRSGPIFIPQLPAEQQQLAATELLPAMLRQLLPAVRFVQGAADGAERADKAAESYNLLAITTAWVTHSLLGHDSQCVTKPVHSLFRQHLREYAALLEAAMRLRTARGAPMSRSAASFASLFAAVVQHGASASTPLADAAGHQQVFSLLLSCQKARPQPAEGASDRGGYATTHAYDESPFTTVRWTLKGLTRLGIGGPSSGMAEGIAAVGSGSSRRLWLVLLARCLVSVGSSLQQLVQRITSSDGDDYGDDDDDAWQKARLQQVLASLFADCKAVVAWLGEQELPRLAAAAAAAGGGGGAALAPGLSAAVLQQLQQQQAELLPALTDEEWMASVGSLAGTLVPIGLYLPSSSLAKQLEAFGAAVAAQLPAKQFCNNHQCSNTSQASELQLGGSSCVCSGCKTARYCCAGCQEAHWREWHRPVCKKLKQQRQQQQQVAAE